MDRPGRPEAQLSRHNGGPERRRGGEMQSIFHAAFPMASDGGLEGYSWGEVQTLAFPSILAA